MMGDWQTSTSPEAIAVLEASKGGYEAFHDESPVAGSPAAGNFLLTSGPMRCAGASNRFVG